MGSDTDTLKMKKELNQKTAERDKSERDRQGSPVVFVPAVHVGYNQGRI